jgi:hypothetical protein
MTTDSPASVLYRSDGYELAVVPGDPLPTEPRGLLAAGSDGTNAQLITVDSSGNQVAVGAGVAGTPTGGVITVQGDPSGTPIPVSGSFSNPATGLNNNPVPLYSIQMGGTDGTNLQAAHIFDLDTGGGTEYILGVNLRLSSGGGSVEFGTSGNPIRIDPTGATTQPVSAVSLPLPTGAATETTLASRLADSTFTTRINTLGQKTMANSTPVVLASDQTVIPVSQSGSWTVGAAQSGTWNINNISGTISLPTGASTEASLVKLTLAQGSTTSGQTGALVLGAVTTAAPSYTNAQSSPLSLDTTGALRVSVTTGVGNASVSATGASPPASATYIGGSVTTAAPSYTNGQMDALSLTTTGLLRVDGSSVTQPVSGTVAATQSGTWTVQPGNTVNTTPWLATISQGGNSATVTASNALKVDGSAVTQPVSGTVTANIGTTNGLALDATLAKLTISQSTALGANTQALMGGSVTTAAPSYTTGNINPLSLTTAGALRIDGSGSTQPISGTVAATQSGTWNINNISGTVSLPTGAATETSLAKLTLTQGSTTSGQSGTLMQGAVTTAAPTYTTGQTNPLSLTTAGAVRIDGSAVTQPVSGTVTANAGTGNFTVVQSTASNLRSQTSSESNTAAAVPTQASMVGGTDGTNLRAFSVDTSGRQIVIGAAADGAAVTGNPVLMGGQDGTNAQSILTDTTGRQVMVGAAADGAAVTGNPILIGGQDGTNAQSMLTDTTGRPVVVGAGAAGAPVGGILSTQVPDTTGSGTLNALNTTASIALAGNAGAALQLSSGTLIGTIVPEISYDGGTTWSISLFQDPTNSTYSSSITFSASNGANAQTIVVPNGASNARVRVSLFTSGSATANVRATTAGNITPALLTHTINTTSHALGKITTASTSQAAIRQTTFTEQSSNAQRSVSSSSASDASAGTGARTIKITYYDASFVGPFTVTLTMNGTTTVNTGVTNICFVEKIEVLTVGSTGSNVGTISLFGATAGGGGTIGTIAATDNRTFWAHHYIPSGKNCYITQMHGANSDGTNGTLYVLKAKSLNANSAEAEISGINDGGGQVNQGVTTYQTPIFVAGPARVVLYGTPDSSGSITNRGYFSYYDL